MEKNRLPKVLVIDVNAWREDAPSNTLLDIFRCWEADKLALVYTSSAYPSTKVCSRFFQIGESQVLRSVFKPWIKVGREVENDRCEPDKDTDTETALRNRAHRSFTKLMRIARECVWKMGHWKTKALRDFVKDFNPDVVFVPIFPYAYMGRIQKYILKQVGAPYVCYLADDNYSYDACYTVLDYLHRFWVRQYVGPLARGSKEMFVIVDKEKEDTDRRFGTNSVILTKGIDLSGKEYSPKKTGEPLKFVYTGSLAIGRGETLTEVADVLNRKYNGRGEVRMEIYSQTFPKESVMSRINNGCSHFMGRVSHQEIAQILDNADVVIFAEALEGKERYVAKLSFSTKITDYLSAGKCILAIGDKEIAPIDYFRRNDAALIATNMYEIEQRIEEIIGNHGLIQEYGRKAFECAKRNHDRQSVTERFIKKMIQAKNE